MDSMAAQNRACGACNVCCKLHAILDPELKKMPGVLCAHATPKQGCSIYERRPETCRGHVCAWLQLPQFDDSWRPDRSNIYIELKSDPPEQYRHLFPDAPFAFKFTLVQELTPEWLGKLAFTIAALVASDVPVILAVSAPAEHFGCHMLLNPALKSTAAEAGQPYMEVFALALHTLYSKPPAKVSWEEINNTTVPAGSMLSQAMGA